MAIPKAQAPQFSGNPQIEANQVESDEPRGLVKTLGKKSIPQPQRNTKARGQSDARLIDSAVGKADPVLVRKIPLATGLTRSTSVRQQRDPALTQAQTRRGHGRHASTVVPSQSRDALPRPERRDVTKNRQHLLPEPPSKEAANILPGDGRLKGHTRSTSVLAPRGLKSIVIQTSPIDQCAQSDRVIYHDQRNSPSINAELPLTTTRSENNGIKQSKSSRKIAANRSDTVAMAPIEQSCSMLKPQFSTYQTHLSSLKPSASPKSGNMVSYMRQDTSREALPRAFSQQQIEMLQLQVLHIFASRARREWELDARCHLKDRFIKICTKGRTISEEERASRMYHNDLALRGWADNGGMAHLESRLGVLACAVQELEELCGRGGRYGRIVDHFAKSLQRDHDEMIGNTISTDHDQSRTGNLDSAWVEEVVEIKKKLDRCSNRLAGLETPSARSGLQEVVCRHRELVLGMIEELALMSMIEQDAFRREREHRREEIDGILADGDGPDEPRETSPQVRAWR